LLFDNDPERIFLQIVVAVFASSFVAAADPVFFFLFASIVTRNGEEGGDEGLL